MIVFCKVKYDKYITKFAWYVPQIQAYLDEVVSTYPEIATLYDIGTSYEGRPMRVLKLSNGPGKAGIWFDAAIHAREWIGVPVNLYIINQMTENLAENQDMLDANDFYFLPITNPDGYSYTWTDVSMVFQILEIFFNKNCIISLKFNMQS